MILLFWGLTVSVIGKILLAAGVIIAHSEIAHEHRIDKKVLKSFKVERVLTLAGIVLIVFGYTLEIYFYGFTPFSDCSGDACFANVMTALSQ